MNNLRKLKQTLGQQSKEGIPVVTAWCEVKEVDWNSKTMTATGIMDNLDYNEVLLGIGNLFLKPALKSKCLIGLIENNPAAAFLIDCEFVEAVEIKTDVNYKIEVKEQTLEMAEGKFLLKNETENLLKLMEDLIDANIGEKHMTNSGPSIKLSPDSELKFRRIKTRFGNLLKTN